MMMMMMMMMTMMMGSGMKQIKRMPEFSNVFIFHLLLKQDAYAKQPRSNISSSLSVNRPKYRFHSFV